MGATTIAREAARHHPEVLVLPAIEESELSRLAPLLVPDGYTLVRVLVTWGTRA